ncbi:uncharacterized protein [Littorina saxatilis]|uniref:EF-hand domain-containing protein n=1 Tax=Littorina saxatilis TaxID=31220 RepID=A0AAN9BPA8_9CAEN
MSEKEVSDVSSEEAAGRKTSLLKDASFNPFENSSRKANEAEQLLSSTTNISDPVKDKNEVKDKGEVHQTPLTEEESKQDDNQKGESKSSSEKPPEAGQNPTEGTTNAGDATESAAKQKETSTVSATAAPATPAKRISSSRKRMERELERMRKADENERLRYKARRRKEVKKAVAAMYERKTQDGVTMTPDVEESRTAIRKIMVEEERMALEKDQKKLRQETKAIQDAIDDKYGLKDKKQGHDLLALAEDFYHNKNREKDGLPAEVRRALTNEEIEDLKMVFDMFDLKGRGYITANDVKRAASMLGFKAKQKVFNEMIGEVTGEKNARVTFAHFLQFVVRGQGEGDDPLEDIMRCFRMLDREQKGYLTIEDLRSVSDEQKLPLSNRAIREMIQEADVSGDARVTSDEFIHIMLQTSMFHAFR